MVPPTSSGSHGLYLPICVTNIATASEDPAGLALVNALDLLDCSSG